MKAPVFCPNCSSSFSISRTNAGKKAKCPKCEQPFTISFDEAFTTPEDLESLPPPLPSQQMLSAQLGQGTTKAREVSRANEAPNWLIIAAPAVASLFIGYGVGFLHHRSTTLRSSAGGTVDNGQGIPVPQPQPATFAPEAPGPTAAAPKATPKSATLGLSEQEREIAKEAVTALSKIEAAIEIGVNYQKYTSLLVDVNAVVNEADRNLPSSAFLVELNQTILAYKDVAEIWSFKIQYSNIGSSISKEFHGEIIGRYGDSLPKEDEIDTDVAMQLIWVVAGKHLETARRMLR